MNSYKHLDVFIQGRKVGTLAVTPERTVAFAYDRKWLADGFSLNKAESPEGA